MKAKGSPDMSRLAHTGVRPTNEEVATLIDEAARLLEAQSATPFRVICRRAASLVRRRRTSWVRGSNTQDERR